MIGVLSGYKFLFGVDHLNAKKRKVLASELGFIEAKALQSMIAGARASAVT